jgi:polysaccharide chain length determinant protein (PEP-CTERM system associated)
MMGHRQLGWDDYVAIWRRRRRWIVVPLIIGPVLLYAIALVLPSSYESDTLVLIQRQIIPSNLVPSTITQDLNARVVNLQQQVLSRTRLEPLIKRYDLFKENAAGQPMELLVEQLRKAITLTPVKPIVRSRDETLPGFSIGVTLSTARSAQQVCADLTSMFIEENLRQREQSARGTTSFLQAQADDAKRQLDEQDAKLADFKRRHIHELPDEAQTNLKLLDSLNGQLQAADQALTRLQQDTTYTESLLAQEVAAWKATQALGDKEAPQTLDQQLEAMQRTLDTLETQYTQDYPDVVKLKAEIAQVKQKLHDQGASPETKPEVEAQRPSAPEPTHIQQLRSTLRAYNDAMGAQTKARQHLQEQIELLQSRIQMIPAVEQEYKEITRDYQEAQGFYNDMLKKKSESGLATEMEQRQQGEQLIIMDPANLPMDPTFPNRPLFALGGLGVGLVVGLLLAWLREMRDKSLRNEKDIEACLGLPTLATVPSLTTAAAKKKWFQKTKTPKPGAVEGLTPGIEGSR